MDLFPEIDTQEILKGLVNAGMLDEEASHRANAASLETNTGIEKTLLELGLLQEEPLFRFLAEKLDVEFIEEPTADTGIVDLLSREFLERVEIVPFKGAEDGLVLATCDPRANETLRSIGFHLKTDIKPAIAVPSAIKSALADQDTLIPDRQSDLAAGLDVKRLRALANDGPVIKLVNDLITRAVGQRASDIHIEAMETGARARFRIDGVLNIDRTIADKDRAAIASRLKVMANLNISEKRRPQDGRAQITVRGQRIDIRLSTLPTQFGESIVLRILDRQRVELEWSALGFRRQRISDIEEIINAPHGLFLVSGPTGSGKTTTLYTALSKINSEERKIVTVEDPIEFSLPGISQVQADPQVDMTFAHALRAILRQDPDVVMVGEIRDEETAEIAVRAALVGRLVLSTIHTNDAISAIARLTDLGVPPYLIGSTLRGVLAQRLIRKNCEKCKGCGCTECKDTGRKGRVVVSELLKMNNELEAAISAGATQRELQSTVEISGFVSIADDGRYLTDQNVVSPCEVNLAI